MADPNRKQNKMNGEPSGLLRRLALAVLIAASLSVTFDWAAGSAGALISTQISSSALAFVLAAAAYGVSIPGLYFVALGADKVGIARWLVFPFLFVALRMGYSYVSLSDFGRDGAVSSGSVEGGTFIASGWTYWEQNIAGTAAIALIVTIVMFGWPSAWLRDDANLHGGEHR